MVTILLDLLKIFLRRFGSVTGPLNYLRECARCRKLEHQLEQQKMFERETFREVLRIFTIFLLELIKTNNFFILKN